LFLTSGEYQMPDWLSKIAQEWTVI
jgi:hypothetical protein